MRQYFCLRREATGANAIVYGGYPVGVIEEGRHIALQLLLKTHHRAFRMRAIERRPGAQALLRPDVTTVKWQGIEVCLIDEIHGVRLRLKSLPAPNSHDIVRGYLSRGTWTMGAALSLRVNWTVSRPNILGTCGNENYMPWNIGKSLTCCNK